MRSPAPPSLTATPSRIEVHGVESNVPSLFVSRSALRAPVNPSTSSRLSVPFSSAFAARVTRRRPSASVVPSAMTSSTVPVACRCRRRPRSRGPCTSRAASAALRGSRRTRRRPPRVLAENSLITTVEAAATGATRAAGNTPPRIKTAPPMAPSGRDKRGMAVPNGSPPEGCPAMLAGRASRVAGRPCASIVARRDQRTCVRFVNAAAPIASTGGGTSVPRRWFAGP